MAERCDAIVVIGSSNSSNTRALAKLAEEAGCRARVPHQHRRATPRRSRPARSGSPPARRLPRSSWRAVLDQLAPSAWCRSWCGSPTRTSTSRRRARSASCRTRSRSAATALLGGSLLTRPGMDDRVAARRARCSRRSPTRKAARAQLRPLDTLRLFIHVLAASVWVGGQIVLAGIVPEPAALRFGGDQDRGERIRSRRLASVRHRRRHRALEPRPR